MKTERTLRLLQEIKSQGPVSNWKEGPNLIEVDRVIKGCEKKLAKIHSMNMESSVIDYLETSEHKPFSLSSLEGILILSHEPDFNIQQKKVFNGPKEIYSNSFDVNKGFLCERFSRSLDR